MVIVGHWNVTGFDLAFEPPATSLLWPSTDRVGITHCGLARNGGYGLLQMEAARDVPYGRAGRKPGAVQPHYMGLLTRTCPGCDHGASAHSLQYGGHGGVYARDDSLWLGCGCLYARHKFDRGKRNISLRSRG